MNYLLDTCVLIDIARGDKKSVTDRFLSVSKNDDIIIPQYVLYEFLCGLKVKKAHIQYKKFITLYKYCTKPYISDLEIADKATDIYASCRESGLPTASIDLLIAAYSILTNSVLVTSNEKHFSGINGLTIENWRNITK